MRIINLGLALSAMVFMVGCATGGSNVSEQKFDPKAAEKARPYLANHYGLDFRTSSQIGTCVQPKADGDWKSWVQAAGACVQKQDWSQVEKLGTEMSARQVDSPWGPYFLGMAALSRGEVLRAHWMLDLAEKKAGGPLGLVRYEKARLLEKDEGVAAAATEMKNAVKVDPTLLPGLLWLAQVHHRDRMLPEAEKYYRATLQLKNDVFPALAGLADIMLENKNDAEAADLLKRAVALKPGNGEMREKLKAVEKSLKPVPPVQAREREPAQQKKGG